MRALQIAAVLLVASPGAAQESSAPETSTEGLLPVPDLSGGWSENPKLTGDWGGARQGWADRGFHVDLDWVQAFQDIASGGVREGSGSSTNLDYQLTLDLMRAGLVPGAAVRVRGQSRFGSTVNGDAGLLLPVNSHGAFPLASDPDGDVDVALTELYWLQYLSDDAGLTLGKITTLGTANEFMGGAGKSQFMNFQFLYSPVFAQLAPYSTLAAGGFWALSPTWKVTSTVMNISDASTSSGFDDFGDGGMWMTSLQYDGSLNDLPGGGTLSVSYGFDADFSQVGGLNFSLGSGVQLASESSSWAANWSGWQYLTAEEGAAAVDPTDGAQDLQGIGTFMQVGLGDEDTNPVSWSVAWGLSGRGTLEGRDDDTWGAGVFYNDLQQVGLGLSSLASSTSGLELYYDLSLAGSTSLTLDAQWLRSAFKNVDDALVLGLRLNVSL